MRLFDSIRRSGRRLRHAKMRTILTILAISVGSFALALTFAAGEGARQFVDRLVESNFNPNSLYVFKEPEGTAAANPFEPNSEPQEYSGRQQQLDASGFAVLLNDEDIEKVAAVDGVENVVPVLNVSAEYVTTGDKQYVAEVTSDQLGVTYTSLAGEIPDQLAADQVVLPETFLNVLGFANAQDAIGESVTVQYSQQAAREEIAPQAYTIVAVAEKPSGLVGGATQLIVSQESLEEVAAQQLGDRKEYTSLIANLADDSVETTNQVKAVLGAADYQSLSAKEIAEQITQAVNIIQAFVAGFGVLALLVSVFGIINTQLISVLERTREIGLMKALGMSGSGVLRLFVLEAIWIGFGGAVLGLFLAYFLSIFANPALDSFLGIGGNLLIFLPSHIIGLIVLLMVVAALSGLLPAWKAARLNPVEALRTE